MLLKSPLEELVHCPPLLDMQCSCPFLAHVYVLNHSISYPALTECKEVPEQVSIVAEIWPTFSGNFWYFSLNISKYRDINLFLTWIVIGS